MFVVWHSYSDKAEKYVRMHGKNNFGGGGSFHDVLYVLKNYGIVPEEIYTGLNYGEDMHVHNELDKLTEANIQVVPEFKGKLTPSWKTGFDGILDAY